MRAAPLIRLGLRLGLGLGLGLGLAACGGGDGDGDGSDAAPDAPDLGPQGVVGRRVTHYDLAIDLSTRAAHVTVTAAVTAAGNCLALDYKGAAPTAVRLDGEDATVTVTADTLTACRPHGHAVDETMTLDADVTIALSTLSASQVGYSVTADRVGNPLTYLLDWVGECSRFVPCDARPGVFATYTTHITHPAGLAVKCSGVVTDPSPTETVCDFEYAGGPAYSTLGFVAYPAWTAQPLGTWGSASVTLYDRAGSRTAAEIDSAYHAGFLAWMESTFGAYPYGSDLRVLVAPTYWSGFEHPGNIVLDDALAPLAGTYDVAHTLDHEMAHQWAGDETTLADTYDFVWKEAMAEYLAFAYEADAKPAFAASTADAWKRNSVGGGFFPVPGERPALFTYYGAVYGPGPLILFRQLEVLSSRAQVIAALQSVLGSERTLSMEQLVAALAAHTGLDLGAYAAAWIYGSGTPAWPHVRTTFTAGPTTSTLAVTLTLGAERRCKFHVALRGAAGEETLVAVDTFRDGPTQMISMPTPAYAVTAIVLDPADECLVLAATGPPLARPTRRPWLSPRVVDRP